VLSLSRPLRQPKLSRPHPRATSRLKQTQQTKRDAPHLPRLYYHHQPRSTQQPQPPKPLSTLPQPQKDLFSPFSLLLLSLLLPPLPFPLQFLINNNNFLLRLPLPPRILLVPPTLILCHSHPHPHSPPIASSTANNHNLSSRSQ
jgi:hypothetical protein